MSIRPMSMKWDALLARHTAFELSRALVGKKLRALRLDGEALDVTLLLEERTLVWALHPRRGWPHVLGPSTPVEGDFKLRGHVLGIDAPLDERVVRLALSPAGGRALQLIVELMGNQWNALLVEGEPGVVRHVLRRRDGARPQRVGEPYRPPLPLARAGQMGDVTEVQWIDALADVPEHERAGALVRTFAWTSPLNASALLGAEPGGEVGLRAGYERWKSMVGAGAHPDPVLLELSGGPQPYPFPLVGTPSRPTESLLGGFEVCAAEDQQAHPTASAGLDATLIAGLEGALRRANGRVTRIEAELAGLDDPAEQRALGDLILARYADIPHGASRAELTGFDGKTVEVELEPTDPPHANAARYYARATKAERAVERLPPLLGRARAAHARAADLVARARDGTADEAEVRAILGDGGTRADVPRETRPALPYRVYRSSGGLEIRVGRGARHNDDLTFHYSSPDDVWLHARHVGGAHVILRWPGPGNPPARDLAEAAALAAAHSKARTSASVPVDWTFRKYVRKPRKAPPGRVAADRIETVFVTPDPALVRSLAGS